MERARGGGLILVAIILFILGVVLRWDLIKWLIDATGLVLIVVAIVLGVVGVIQMMSGGDKGSSSTDF